MKEKFVLIGHVDEDGTVISDEPAPLPPCKVKITVESHVVAPKKKNFGEVEAHARRIEYFLEAESLSQAVPPKNGLSAKDYKKILYGDKHRRGVV